MANLFVIGNGFDIQHNVHYLNDDKEKITTNLVDFSKELQKNHPKIFSKIQNEVKNAKVTWNNLERIKFRDALTEEEYSQFYEQLKCWIKNLDRNISYKNFKNDCKKIEEYHRLKNGIFDDETYFINFNYTRTIENLYGYEGTYQDNIIHLHGNSNQPILAYFGKLDFQKQIRNQNKIDFRKPVDGLREYLGDWVQNKLKEASFVNIYVYGFGFYRADSEYLRTILDCLCSKGKVIKVCDYQAKNIKNNEKGNLRDIITSIIKFYDNCSYKIEIVDFEENSLI
ncbi:AbiH family protein [Tetragenococcus halophilus]|uniref:AbiH family protein n=1 Tax=Tetragenococcus halophilus TaxID=51669 RepID=UPI00209B07B8|nr:AbiH family protein [Tetragenococcus halophilus]MCO8291387.1 hypothetical protein [Tetragenococcus halophilus]